MPLCSKCHQNEATVHINMNMNGDEERLDLCQPCSQATGLFPMDPTELEALSVVGKKCEFCGKDAISGVGDLESTVHWCCECGLEFGRILSDLCISERPDLMQRSKEKNSFLSFCSDPELQAWSKAANQKAVQILKERRRQDGRDKGS